MDPISNSHVRIQMYGQNCSGQLVSLLQPFNSDFSGCSNSSSGGFLLPKPRQNSEASIVSASTSYLSFTSSDAAAGSGKSNINFDTPPLYLADSTSSNSTANTPSPMTPAYMYPEDPLREAFPLNACGIYTLPPTPVEDNATILPRTILRKRTYAEMQEPLQSGLDSSLVFVPLSSQAVTEAHSPLNPPFVRQLQVRNLPARNVRYPCPLAKDFNCNESFTTSGHASRHSKKHTGEKNVRCSLCNKAFTRRDNMRQHERTHHKNEAAVRFYGERRTRGRKMLANVEATAIDYKNHLASGLHTLANAVAVKGLESPGYSKT